MNKNKIRSLIMAVSGLFVAVIFIFYTIYTYNFFSISPLNLFSSVIKDISLFNPKVIIFLSLHVIRFVFVSLLFFNIWWIGNRLLSLLKFDSYPEEKHTILSMGLGLGISGYLVFLLGILGFLTKTALVLLLVITSFISLIHTLKSLRNGSNTFRFKIVKPKFNIYFILIIPFLILFFFATTLPEIFYDSLVYHLAIPDIYLKAGRLVNIPTNIYSSLPHLMSLIYTYGLIFNDALLVKVISFFIGLLLIYTIYIAGKELSVLIFLSIPLVALNLWCAGSDIGMAFFLLLGLILFKDWLFEQKENKKLLYLSGLLFGFASACKLTAMLGLPFLIVIIIYNYKNSFKNSYKTMFLFLLCVSLPLIPWFCKNCIFSGNPFLPFFTKIFGSGPWGPGTLNSFFLDTKSGYDGFNSAFSGLKKIFTSGITGAESGRAGFMGPVFLLLIPLMLIYFKDKKVKFAIYYCASCILVWLFSTHMVRHLFPHLIILFIAISFMLENNKKLKIALALLLFTNIYWIALIFQTKYDGLKIITGQCNANAYLSIQHQNIYHCPSYPAYKYLEENSSTQQDRVLIAGEARGFYCKNPAISNSQHDSPVFFDAIAGSAGPAALREWASLNKIKFLIFNWIEVKRLLPEKYRQERYFKSANIFLDKYTKKVYADNYLEVYKVCY